MSAPAFVVTSVHFTPASSADVARGLHGYLSFILNDGLRLDGITLRATKEGRTTLSYPSKRTCDGEQKPFVCPVNDVVRRIIECAVLTELGLEEASE